jgi:RNA polymerase sigma-70 factor, ECF subfamily
VDRNQARAFEESLLGWLDDAYNLARWLMRNDHDAEDAVQEAYLRAVRFAGGFRGGDRRAWLLAIVRNVCYTQLSRLQATQTAVVFDEEHHGTDLASDPENAALRNFERQNLARALEDLPIEFREAIVMREMEGLSYKEIAAAVGVPIGTVMSRLARARDRLRDALSRATGNVSELQRRASANPRIR